MRSNASAASPELRPLVKLWLQQLERTGDVSALRRELGFDAPEPPVDRDATYVFALGPVPTDEGAFTSVLAVSVRGARMLAGDPELAIAREAARGKVVAAAGLARVAPLSARRHEGPVPRTVREVAAGMAFHLSVAPGLAADVGPELTAELQAAARAFQAGAPWRFVTDATPVRLEVGAERRDAVVMGNAGIEFGLALYAPGDHARLLRAAGRDRRDALGADVLAFTLDEEPAFAVEAAVAAGFPRRIPRPYRVRGGRPAPLTAADVRLLAAAARACAGLRPGSAHTGRAETSDGREVRVVIGVAGEGGAVAA